MTKQSWRLGASLLILALAATSVGATACSDGSGGGDPCDTDGSGGACGAVTVGATSGTTSGGGGDWWCYDDGASACTCNRYPIKPSPEFGPTCTLDACCVSYVQPVGNVAVCLCLSDSAYAEMVNSDQPCDCSCYAAQLGGSVVASCPP